MVRYDGSNGCLSFTVRPEAPDLNRKYTWFERGGPVSTYLLLKKAEELTGESRFGRNF